MKETSKATRPPRKKAGGWIASSAMQRNSVGAPLCRWCNGEVQGRRRTFCSPECVHQWKLRTDPGYLREKVFERDRGVCAQCGIDTVIMRRDMRKLDFAARRTFLREWGLREGSRKSLWDADHVLPVAEGGGQCDLSNMRTLCLKCHREATNALRMRLKNGAVISGSNTGSIS